MDESRFVQLAGRARRLASDYGAGYTRGLRRCYHGDSFGTRAEHELWSRLGLDGDPRTELGRGYRDGLAGREPEPLLGRPALPPGAGRTARVEWRTTEARKARAQQFAADAGVTLSVWVDRAVDGAVDEAQ